MDVAGRLQALGLNLKREWVDRCVGALSRSEMYSNASGEMKAGLLLEEFRHTDIRLSSRGSLPKDVTTWHRQTVQGRHVVQVDEITNIAAPSKTRYQGSSGKSCMQMKISDGEVETCAFEYQPVPFLRHDTPPGCKIAITGAQVVRGILMLTPENTEFLGGQVGKLVEAYKAVAAHCNQKSRPDTATAFQNPGTQSNPTTRMTPPVPVPTPPSNPMELQQPLQVRPELPNTATTTTTSHNPPAPNASFPPHPPNPSQQEFGGFDENGGRGVIDLCDSPHPVPKWRRTMEEEVFSSDGYEDDSDENDWTPPVNPDVIEIE